MELLIILIPLFLIFAVNVAIWVRRGLQIKQLAERGMPGRAVVVKKFPRRKQRTRIQYEFSGTTDQPIRHNSMVSAAVYQSIEVGRSIDIEFLPENPKVNAPKYLVEQARTALQKRSGT